MRNPENDVPILPLPIGKSEGCKARGVCHKRLRVQNKKLRKAGCMPPPSDRPAQFSTLQVPFRPDGVEDGAFAYAAGACQCAKMTLQLFAQVVYAFACFRRRVDYWIAHLAVDVS